jgi:hypothetical protein
MPHTTRSVPRARLTLTSVIKLRTYAWGAIFRADTETPRAIVVRDGCDEAIVHTFDSKEAFYSEILPILNEEEEPPAPVLAAPRKPPPTRAYGAARSLPSTDDI